MKMVVYVYMSPKSCRYRKTYGNFASVRRERPSSRKKNQRYGTQEEEEKKESKRNEGSHSLLFIHGWHQRASAAYHLSAVLKTRCLFEKMGEDDMRQLGGDE